MKIEVLQKFIDKHTGEIHHAGDIMDVEEERYKEIKEKNKNLVKIVETEENESEEIQKDQLDKLKVDELKSLAESMGIEAAGKKAELIEQIMEKQGESKNED